jgi:hypothetical protein
METQSRMQYLIPGLLLYTNSCCKKKTIVGPKLEPNGQITPKPHCKDHRPVLVDSTVLVQYGTAYYGTVP